MSSFILPMPPSANGLFANGKHGGRFKTQRYCDWINEAGVEIMRQRPHKYVGPVTLLYEVQRPKGRRFDLGNREKALTDLLVSHRIIQADDDTIVQEIRLKWAGDDLSGVRVTVSEFFTASPKIEDGAEAA